MRLSCARSSSGLRSGFCLHLRKDRTSEQELQIPLWSQRHAAAFRTPGDPHGQTHGGPSERAHRGCAKSLASAHHTLSSCPGWRARLVTCPRCHVLESRFSQTVNGAQSRTCHPAPHTQASRGLQSVPGATSPQTAAVATPTEGTDRPEDEKPRGPSEQTQENSGAEATPRLVPGPPGARAHATCLQPACTAHRVQAAQRLASGTFKTSLLVFDSADLWVFHN